MVNPLESVPAQRAQQIMSGAAIGVSVTGG